MKLILASVGKPHDPVMKPGIDEFTKRLSNYYRTEWLILPVPKQVGSLPEDQQKKKEAELILQHIERDDYLVALEERGKQWSSPELADFIQSRANESTKRIVFLIGGAFGLDESVWQRANFKWSLSKLVFPHQLARLILAEQVYRACTILKNEKYHHK